MFPAPVTSESSSAVVQILMDHFEQTEAAKAAEAIINSRFLSIHNSSRILELRENKALSWTVGGSALEQLLPEAGSVFLTLELIPLQTLLLRHVYLRYQHK